MTLSGERASAFRLDALVEHMLTQVCGEIWQRLGTLLFRRQVQVHTMGLMREQGAVESVTAWIYL